MVVQVTHSPTGRGWRCYFRGRRVHHGKTGAYLVGVGAVLMFHDWRDRRAWFGVEFLQDSVKKVR